jgi:Trm5-related predicted tRNA methylase
MEELQLIVPACDRNRKTDVLSKTIDYIIFLRKQYDDLLERSNNLQKDYFILGGKSDYLGLHLTQPATSHSPKDNTPC